MKKIKTTNKTAGSIGLVSAICLIISSVVGVGVFFKNGSVFNNNNNNQTGIILSWCIATVIALFTAFSFAEIVTVKGLENPNAGLSGWAQKLVGYNFGRHVSITQSTFYYAAKLVAMSTYSAICLFIVYFAATKIGNEDTIQFDAKLLGIDSKYTTLIVMSIAFCLIFFFLLTNFFSKKFGQIVSKGATFVKFVPILMISLIGIIIGCMINKNLTYSFNNVLTQVNVQADNNDFINGIFRSIPAILFSFDSFLIIGNVSKNVKNAERNVPLSIIISMIIAAVFQIMITIGCITIGEANPFQLIKIGILDHCKSKVGYIICATILSVSLIIATFGVLNSYSLAGTKATQALIDDEIIVGYKWAKRISNKHENLGALFIYSFFIILIFMAIAIPSSIVNTSHIYDGFSTLAVLFYFGIYGTTILGGLINRITKKNQVQKVWYFIPFGIIAVIGCYFTFAYSCIYQFLWQVIENPFGNNDNSFGFSLVVGTNLNNWQAATIFWSAALFFIGFPFINDLIIKISDRNYTHALIWQNKKELKSYNNKMKGK